MKQIFDSALVLRLVFRFRVRETEEPNRDRVRETKTTRIGMGEGGQENGERGEERTRRPSDKVESTRGTATFSY